VPIDETEFGKLVARLSEHEQQTGTRFGFVTALLQAQATAANC